MKQEFTQAIKNSINEIIQDMHTVIPGKIIEFDAEKCEASIQPTAKFREPNGTTMDFSQLHNVPVYFMQGAGQSAVIAYPIEKGDDCILLIAEQALDQWRTGEESSTELRFDLTNAIAIPGLFARPNRVIREAQESKAIIIAKGRQRITITDETINLTGNTSYNGNMTVNGNLQVNGSANITESLYVGKNIIAGENMIVSQDAEIDGSLTVSKNADITGNAEVGGKLTVTQDLTAKSNVDITGNETVGGDLTVDGKINAKGDVDIAGTLTLNGININKHVHGGVTAGDDETGTPS